MNLESKIAIVVTSISKPNFVLSALAEGATKSNRDFFVVGDRKSPESFILEGADFVGLERQFRLDFDLAKKLPEGHYSRKNIGYLMASADGANVIIETDDDNLPLDSFWEALDRNLSGRTVLRPGWVNSYSYFCEQKVWPRGLPLEQVRLLREDRPTAVFTKEIFDCPVQQRLANGDTDVDAIYRILDGALVEFEDEAPLILSQNVWTPFNSQSTIWWSEAFPLLYLPSTCSFRMTDIWRSFVAQRCMWECGWRLAVTAPIVVQERNYHDLNSDFKMEVPGYLHNDEIRKSLESLSLKRGVQFIGGNMLDCYAKLVSMKLVDDFELQLLDSYLTDLASTRERRIN